ncbi:MAG: hypothetical protein JWQ43_1962 [Glaciihabitans sp.]|nr:hypothetical protein [Glaciihabitans sp.]
MREREDEHRCGTLCGVEPDRALPHVQIYLLRHDLRRGGIGDVLAYDAKDTWGRHVIEMSERGLVPRRHLQEEAIFISRALPCLHY